MNITIYTDGSCLNNPGPGGWAYIALNHSAQVIAADCGAAANTTNNQMELTAVIEALSACNAEHIELYSDSTYVIKAINEWLESWIKTDFKGRKNPDLWRKYLAIASGKNITAKWIRAHAGDYYNELCDIFARQSASGDLQAAKEKCQTLIANAGAKEEHLAPLDETASKGKSSHAAITSTSNKTAQEAVAQGYKINFESEKKYIPATLPASANAAEKFAALEAALGFAFNDYGLLERALRHKSAGKLHNERLEFLGDAVMDLSIAQLLFEDPSRYNEGDLSKLRAALVNEQSFAKIARSLNLGELLELSSAEERSGGRDKPSLLSDAFEALMGVIYLQGGFLRAHEVALRLISSNFERIDPEMIKDYKTRLQELTQERFAELPEYRVLASFGPDHAKEFSVGVFLGGVCRAKATARSKKAAEQASAERLYNALIGEAK